MIAKYPGKCATCGRPTVAGRDIYDVETKKNFHGDCQNPVDLFSASEAEQLAERLHFVAFDTRESVRWSELRYSGPLK